MDLIAGKPFWRSRITIDRTGLKKASVFGHRYCLDGRFITTVEATTVRMAANTMNAIVHCDTSTLTS